MPQSTNSTVNLSVTDSLATIEFFTEKANSLSSVELQQLVAAIEDASNRDDVSTILIRSRGETFCAGASFQELKSLKTAVEAKEFLLGFGRVMFACITSSKPVIARIHGKAAGGGVGIIGACDYAIALANTSARLPEYSLGFAPSVISPVLEVRIGRAAFSAMSLDTKWRDSAWCERHTLFSRVVQDEAELDNEIREIIKVCNAAGAIANANLKKLFWPDAPQMWREMEQRAEANAELIILNKARIDAAGK